MLSFFEVILCSRVMWMDNFKYILFEIISFSFFSNRRFLILSFLLREQKAGFEENRIVECHGSIHWIQAGSELAPAHNICVEIDEEKFEAKEPLPQLNGRLARPNVLMFGDSEWISVRK